LKPRRISLTLAALKVWVSFKVKTCRKFLAVAP
jgi:hypothetical protein